MEYVLVNAGTDKEEKRVSDPLELGLQMCETTLCVLGKGLGSSNRAVRVLLSTELSLWPYWFSLPTDYTLGGD